MTVNRLSIVIASLVFCCCDSFITIVDVDIPSDHAKIVVNSVVSADSIIKVNVSLSKSTLDPGYTHEEEKNAVVTIKNNEGYVASLSFHEEKDDRYGTYNYFYYNEDVVAEETESYSIDVSVPGYGEVTATTFNPARIAVDKVEKGANIVKDGNSYRSIKLSIKDPSDKNYYRIRVEFATRYYEPYYQDTIDQKYFFPIQLSVEGFEEGDYREQLLIKDILFNGQEHQFNILFLEALLNFRPDAKTKLHIYLDHVNEDLFTYLESKYLQNSVEGDPFAQPVQVYNNIQNGLGIFGAYSTFAIEYIP